MNAIKPLATVAAALSLLAATPAAADEHEPQWDEAQRYTLTLFQPGQSAWEWLLVRANHGSGARRMREGRICLSCHADEEEVIGDRIASGEILEPDPLSGMPGHFDAELAMLRDEEQLHLRIAWESLADGEPVGDSEHPARVTVLLGSEALPTASIAGCWAACHVDSPGMPEAHPDEPTKYLPNSRESMTATGGTDVVSDAELEQELAEGRFLEYWQAVLGDTELAERNDGYFLEARRENEEPELSATARRENGRWVVELARPLRPAGGPRKTLEPGVGYTLAIAIHENYADDRHHYVSLPVPMIVEAEEVRIEPEAD